VIDQLADAGLPVLDACPVLEVSQSVTTTGLSVLLSNAALRRAWLAGLIAEIHGRARGTYGAPRIHAELRQGMNIRVSKKTVAKVMKSIGIARIPRRSSRRHPKNLVTTEDLVNRKFLRSQPNLLWVTDITEHHTP
jgi:putative transposase